MKSYNEFLLIEGMNVSQAFEILEIDPKKEFDLRDAYKKAAIKNHPDKGGSTEKMQMVNAAYDLLQKMNITSQSQSPLEKYKEGEKKAQETNKKVIALLKTLFDPEVFRSHFQKYVPNEKLQVEEKIHESRYSVFFEYSFFTSKKETVFTFTINVNNYDIAFDMTLGGGDGNITFTYSTDAVLYHEKRKQKMKQRTWDIKKQTADMKNPETFFPDTVLKKVFAGQKTKKMSKKDFILALQRELGAIIDYHGKDILFYVSLFKDYSLLLRRYTFGGIATWQAPQIMKKTKFNYKKEIELSHKTYAYEDENFLNFLLDLVKKVRKFNDNQKIAHEINTEFEKFRNEQKIA